MKKILYLIPLFLLHLSIEAQIFLNKPPLYNPNRITGANEQTNLIDIEGDGDLDLLVAASTNNNQLQVFVNNGSDMDSVFVLFNYDNLSEDINFNEPTDVEVVDIDHDGDDDIVVRNFRTVLVHRNDGDGVFTVVELDFDFTGSFVNVIGMEFGDIDNDGLTDIIFGTFQPSEVIWARNTGNLSFSDTEVLLTAGQLLVQGQTRISSMAVFDVDNDNDSDVFVTHHASGTTDFSYLAINNGDDTYAISQIFNSPRSTTATADFNGDGFMDFARSNNDGNGNITYYLNDGANNFPETVLRNFTTVMSTVRANNVFAADVDNDGDQDIIAGLVVGLTTGRAAIYFNDGAANFSNETIVFVATNFATFQGGTQTIKENSILPFDFDDDGDVDFITNSQLDGNISLQVNEGDGTYETQILNIQLEELTNIQYLDINDDGFEDIITVSASFFQGKMLVSFGNAGGGFDPARHLIIRNAFAPEDGLVTDVDKDGNWDYVYANSREVRWVSDFQNNGISQLLYTSVNVTSDFSSGTIGFANSTQRAFQVADIDNDGDNDVLVADMVSASVGQIAWLENDGNQNFTSRALSINIDSYQLADINNDGELDLITLDFIDLANTNFRVYTLNKVTKQFGIVFTDQLAYDGRLASQEFTVADPDMDGDNDIILNGMDWLENIGNESFEDVASLLGAPSGLQGTFSRIIASDINGDGAPDFLGSAATNTPSQFVAINNGDNTYTLADELIQPGATPDGRVIRFITADLNNDGLQDIITGRQTGESLTVELYETSLKSRQNLAFPTFASGYGTVSTLEATSNSGLNPTYSTSTPTTGSIDDNQITITGVGELTVTVHFPENDDFIAGEISQTITTSPAPLTVTADSQSRPYGSENPELTITFDGFVLDDDETDLTGLAISTTAEQSSPIGQYPITISGIMTDNYTITLGSTRFLTVTQAQLDATADDQTKVYGEENPELTISYSGFVLGEDKSVLTSVPVVSTSADATSSVQDFTISVSGGAADNYFVNPVSGVLSITQAPLMATAENKTRIYGEPNPELTIVYSGFVNGDDASGISTPPTISTIATAETRAGVVPITLTGGMTNNYAITNADGVLTIDKATLTATPVNQTRAYGAQNPDFTVAYTGFVNGDDETDLTTSPSATTAATVASDVGEYPVTLSGGDAINYNFNFNPGALTVSQATLMATASDQSKIYGGENPELSIAFEGFVNGDNESVFTSAPVAATSVTNTSDVGEYPITLSGGEAVNYSFELNPGILKVTQATLTATANDQSRVYGEDNPELTIAYEGFVNGDDQSVFTSAPSVTTAAIATSDVGEYPISLSGGESLNYSFQLIQGTLTVTQAMLTVTADDKSRVYGEQNPVLSISYDGFVNGDDASVFDTPPVISTTADVTSDVGAYPITIAAEQEASNYEVGVNNGILTVTPAMLTASADDKTRTYGADNPSLTITYDGFVNDDTVEDITEPVASVNANVASPVGEYGITLTGGDAANYGISLENGTLSVTPATLIARASDATRNKGEQNLTFQIEYEGFVNSETAAVIDVEPTASTQATETSDRGTYDITLSGGSDDNYDLELINGTLTVTGPVFETPASITFDPLVLGDQATEDISLQNTGDGELSVSAIALPAGYSVDRSVFSLANGSSTSISLTFTPTQGGVFSGDLVITSNDGERSIALSGEGQIVTAIDDEVLDIEEVSIYPNPASHRLTVDMSDSPARVANLMLVDLKGNTVWSTEAVSEKIVKINLERYTEGIYLLFVETEKGSVIKKVSVQR